MYGKVRATLDYGKRWKKVKKLLDINEKTYILEV
jgi:hypothetical protein